MNQLEQLTLEKSREYQVVKSNDIVLKTRYDFSVNEQKTLAYVCSMIKPRTEADKVNKTPFVLEYEFTIHDYINILGIDGGGRVYNEVKALLKGLSDKSMWFTLADGSETLVRWISKVWTNKRSGIVRVRLDEDLIPHLFDLKEKYLSYGLKNILCMKSQYSIRIYEMLKAYYDMKIGQTDKRSAGDKLNAPREVSWTIELEELKKQLMVDDVKSYANFNLFKTKVLEIAQREINEMTDIDFQFTPVIKGRGGKTVAVTFTIKNKLPIDRYIADTKNSEKLNKKNKSTETASTVSDHDEELDELLAKLDFDLSFDEE